MKYKILISTFRFAYLLLSPEPCLWTKRGLQRRLLNLNTELTRPLLRRRESSDIMDTEDTEDMEDTEIMGVITTLITNLATVMDMDMDMDLDSNDMDITDRCF